MHRQVAGFIHRQEEFMFSQKTVIAAHRRFGQIGKMEFDDFTAVQNPCRPGFCAVENDFAAPDSLLPLRAGTVGETGGQPEIKP